MNPNFLTFEVNSEEADVVSRFLNFIISKSLSLGLRQRKVRKVTKTFFHAFE